jgi:hypothetical protein
MQFALPFDVISFKRTNVNVAAWVVMSFAVEAVATILTVKSCAGFQGRVIARTLERSDFSDTLGVAITKLLQKFVKCVRFGARVQGGGFRFLRRPSANQS